MEFVILFIIISSSSNKETDLLLNIVSHGCHVIMMIYIVCFIPLFMISNLLVNTKHIINTPNNNIQA